MKDAYTKVLLICLAINQLSCTIKSPKPVIKITQRVEFKDENGNRHYQGLLVNGKKEGVWIEYDDSCRVRDISNFEHGIKDGVHLEFKTAGTLTWVGSFKEGRRDGHWLGFQNNNVLRSEVFLNQEKFIGIGKHYDDNGFLYEDFDYDNDSVTKTYPITKLLKRTLWQEK
jgi:antitoxin component YwqK of YwqJK toxin-antitoxin module